MGNHNFWRILSSRTDGTERIHRSLQEGLKRVHFQVASGSSWISLLITSIAPARTVRICLRAEEMEELQDTITALDRVLRRIYFVI